VSGGVCVAWKWPAQSFASQSCDARFAFRSARRSREQTRTKSALWAVSRLGGRGLGRAGKTASTDTSTATTMPNKEKKSAAPKSGPANSDVNATPHPASPTAPKSGPINSDVNATPGK
jgi:hypothetical protein